jgi:hypothetical protein
LPNDSALIRDSGLILLTGQVELTLVTSSVMERRLPDILRARPGEHRGEAETGYPARRVESGINSGIATWR